ncbi:hypothetical protein FJT64_000099 [Amphibalanus amphitrite]|uniref:Uncharacterized protein n=1 Tax=Amphibalanus amphitrite TaxID=1232801 RepID=A0A6A4WIE7_AMPAM|nr:hypothetical protein FJT64_000099 [Amphibalanus amphitrite]
MKPLRLASSWVREAGGARQLLRRADAGDPSFAALLGLDTFLAHSAVERTRCARSFVSAPAGHAPPPPVRAPADGGARSWRAPAAAPPALELRRARRIRSARGAPDTAQGGGRVSLRSGTPAAAGGARPVEVELS